MQRFHPNKNYYVTISDINYHTRDKILYPLLLKIKRGNKKNSNFRKFPSRFSFVPSSKKLTKLSFATNIHHSKLFSKKRFFLRRINESSPKRGFSQPFPSVFHIDETRWKKKRRAVDLLERTLNDGNKEAGTGGPPGSSLIVSE